MRELSLHILDISENGIAAGADRIDILIHEEIEKNIITIRITDNGRGIPDHLKQTITDPFITTRKTRRVGLGLSLFKESALRCNGHFDLLSEIGKGTTVCAAFQRDHIDRAPMGSFTSTIISLIAGNPGIHFHVTCQSETDTFIFDTAETQQELGDISLTDPVVLQHIKELIDKEIKNTGLSA